MAPEPDPSFIARCAALCEFRATGELLPARKSELIVGAVAGTAAIAKRVARRGGEPPNAVWAWYFAREVASYRAFVDRPMACAPRLIAADDEILVVERVPGAPLARRRRPHAELAPAAVDSLIAMRREIAAWPGTLSIEPPPPRVRSQLRARLLEDPTAPIEWITDGLARAGSRGLIDDKVATRACAAIAAYPETATSHGDLLLRNVVGDTLVDWECAGEHAADWDLALLYTQLAPAARSAIDIGAGARQQAFVALVVFALVRELAFLDAFRAPADAPARRDIAREIEQAIAKLR